MKKKLSKSTIRDLIETFGFAKAYDIVKENDPDSLLLPDPLGFSQAQGNLFEEELHQKPLSEMLAELDAFFEITPEELETCYIESSVFTSLSQPDVWQVTIKAKRNGKEYIIQENPAIAA